MRSTAAGQQKQQRKHKQFEHRTTSTGIAGAAVEKHASVRMHCSACGCCSYSILLDGVHRLQNESARVRARAGENESPDPNPAVKGKLAAVGKNHAAERTESTQRQPTSQHQSSESTRGQRRRTTSARQRREGSDLIASMLSVARVTLGERECSCERWRAICMQERGCLAGSLSLLCSQIRPLSLLCNWLTF